MHSVRDLLEISEMVWTVLEAGTHALPTCNLVVAPNGRNVGVPACMRGDERRFGDEECSWGSGVSVKL